MTPDAILFSVQSRQCILLYHALNLSLTTKRKLHNKMSLWEDLRLSCKVVPPNIDRAGELFVTKIKAAFKNVLQTYYLFKTSWHLK